MPYVYDLEEDWRRPTKRRKISPSYAMARTHPREATPSGEEEASESMPPGEAGAEKARSSSRQEIRTSDREELIQCIKRGERPTWVPKPNLEALCAKAHAEAHGTSMKEPVLQPEYDCGDLDCSTRVQPRIPSSTGDPIERPPSALHSGDFYEQPSKSSLGVQTASQSPQSSNEPFGLHQATPPPWVLDTPRSRFLRMPSDSVTLTASSYTASRLRAPSLGSSLSSSFVMRTPTSPLVQATSSPSLDAIDDRTGQLSNGNRALRRRTLPPHSFASASSSQSDLAISTPVPSMRRESTAPYRTHQARRSLTSFTYQPASSAQDVYPSRHRRLSHASETSPRSRNSMVGSFEESILRGRMSTPPSKPLDFVAQIGVLGKGDCPAKLKCPAHVSVPFPAVFYNYPSTSASRSIADDNPSPYVGTIDLDHHLKPVEEPQRRKKRNDVNDPDAIIAELTGPQNTSIGRALAQQEAIGPQVLDNAPKTLLDGAYRVPQEGQLQVLVKNPNKTAVKLFLIPYSLDGMSPGTKTFVRQRSFSSGPIMENVLSETPLQDSLSSKQILRYLIHLKFCCLSKGKFYLYNNIRIVFANRVPEGKEKLRNEVQLPEPKYSPFVTGSSSRRQSVASSPALSPTSMSERFEMIDHLEECRPSCTSEASCSSAPIPFHLRRSLAAASMPERTDGISDYGQAEAVIRDQDGHNKHSSEMQTPRPQSPEIHGFDRVSTSQRGSPIPWSVGLDLTERRSPSPAQTPGDGLLSKRLREMVQQNRSLSPFEADEVADGQQKPGPRQNP